MKQKERLFTKEMWVYFIAFLATTFVDLFFIPDFFVFLLLLIFAVAMACIVIVKMFTQIRLIRAAKALSQTWERMEKYINSQSIATVVTDRKERIVWGNPAFCTLSGVFDVGGNLCRRLPALRRQYNNRYLDINGVRYLKEKTPVTLDKREYHIYRFIDEDRAVEAATLYRTVLGVVMIVQIDNYDDLLRAVKKEEHYNLVMRIEGLIAEAVNGASGLYQQFARDKYLCVFERKYLSGFMADKFSILDRVKHIETTGPVKPTLSIGVGVRDTLKESYNTAVDALDMALGRGGDQAVLREKNGFKFYGGAHQAPEIRVRVRARMFAKNLRNRMEQCDKVFLVGHKKPDLDCLGAAMGLFACARYLDKRAYIVLERTGNDAVEELVAEMRRNPDYKNAILTPLEAERQLTGQSTVVLLDTQIRSHALAPELIDKTDNLVIIDHHLRGTEHIEKAAMIYHEPYASSASEMVCELVEYFTDNTCLKPLEAQALLAGITIDTKSFSLKTGARTFEAASYLKRIGADTTSIRHLFQDDLRMFTARSNVVQHAAIDQGIAVGVCPKDFPSAQLLAAQSADALLGIRGINASFVLCESNGTIIISGRSIGPINVQMILEKLGGGGHATIAGAQVSGSMEEVKHRLKQAIEEYRKEGTKK